MTARKRSSLKGHSPTSTECAAFFLAEQAEPSSPRRGVREFFRRCGDGRIRAEGEGHSWPGQDYAMGGRSEEVRSSGWHRYSTL